MPTLTRIAAKYGFNQPIPVEPLTKQKRELTQMVHSVSERINETIAHLETISDLRRTRVAEVKAPMARKRRGNLEVKVGYGNRNETICDDLQPQYFPTPSQAIAYLREMDRALNEGALDDALALLLDRYRERAEHARLKRSQQKPSVLMITKEIHIPSRMCIAAE